MTRSWRSITAAWALAALCAPSVAHAGGNNTHVSTRLWHELSEPGRTRARDLLAQAEVQVREANRLLPSDWQSLCERSLGPDFGPESLGLLEARAHALRDLARQALLRSARLDAALSRLRRALQFAPDDAEVLYALGQALMTWEEPSSLSTCDTRRRDDDALQVMQQLRREHPAFMAESVTFDLGLLLTRQQHFAAAAQAYQSAIALSLDGSETPIILANLAEVSMLGGDLENAVKHYERALQLSSAGRDYLLAMWGLGVALDRLGEHDAALAKIDKAIASEDGEMRVLRSMGVFFEPRYERLYYEALGHEVLAQAKNKNRLRELESAAAKLTVFIAQSGPRGAFTPAATTLLAHIEGLVQATRRERPGAPRGVTRPR